jgi:iron(III) transport system ATP-binding protein
MIAVEGLSKRFGTAQAVAGASLGLERGATLVVLGPSGCGKTTLLRLTAAGWAWCSRTWPCGPT